MTPWAQEALIDCLCLCAADNMDKSTQRHWAQSNHTKKQSCWPASAPMSTTLRGRPRPRRVVPFNKLPSIGTTFSLRSDFGATAATEAPRHTFAATSTALMSARSVTLVFKEVSLLRDTLASACAHAPRPPQCSLFLLSLSQLRDDFGFAWC